MTNNHLLHFLDRHPLLKPCGNDLTAALDILVAAYKARNKLLVCGNGGSAADSEHIVAELMKGFLKRRPIPSQHVTQLENAARTDGKALAARLQGTLPAISLVSSVSLTSAIANDTGFDMIFAQQV
jgi:phosphoheptose isomerase